MIRFRHTEDERRYRLLLSQLYQTLVSHTPADQLPGAIHTVAKLEQLLMLEGVRQGVAAAAVSNASKDTEGHNLEHLKAFQLHAHVYGSQDTPLRAVEEEWLAKLGCGHLLDSAWFDPHPMRFAPAVNVPVSQNATPSNRELAHVVGDGSSDDLFADENGPAVRDDDVDIEEIQQLLAEPVQTQPALLDRIREQLLQLASQGYRPGSWDEMIMRLHLLLQVDAGVIDIMLGSPPGRTILDQTGCGDLRPGALGLNLQSLIRDIEPT